MYMLTASVAVMTCVFPVHAAPDRADCGDAGDRWETVKASLPEYVRDGIDRTGDAGLTAEEKEYLAAESRSILDRLFHGSVASFATALCDSGVTKEELEELRRLLEEGEL